MICLELWSMTEGIVFDNFIITSSRQVADDWASDTWRLKQKLEGVSGSAVSYIIFIINNISFDYLSK